MKFSLLTVPAIAAAIVIAAHAASSDDGNAADVPVSASPPVKVETAAAAPVASTGVMPAGPLFKPLTPEEFGHDPVAVPEPVWASVLAACALALVRRARSF